jgi:hypothetical protein
MVENRAGRDVSKRRHKAYAAALMLKARIVKTLGGLDTLRERLRGGLGDEARCGCGTLRSDKFRAVHVQLYVLFSAMQTRLLKKTGNPDGRVRRDRNRGAVEGRAGGFRENSGARFLRDLLEK